MHSESRMEGLISGLTPREQSPPDVPNVLLMKPTTSEEIGCPPPTETGVHIEANFSQADVYSFEKRFNDLYLKLLSRTPCRPMAGKLTTIQYLF